MLRPRLALTLAVFALPLAACADDTPADEGDTTVIVEDNGAMPSTGGVPAAAVAPEADDNGDSISISEDGVRATVNDGNTTVSADVDGNPSLNVEVD